MLSTTEINNAYLCVSYLLLPSCIVWMRDLINPNLGSKTSLVMQCYCLLVQAYFLQYVILFNTQTHRRKLLRHQPEFPGICLLTYPSWYIFDANSDVCFYFFSSRHFKLSMILHDTCIDSTVALKSWINYYSHGSSLRPL